MDNQKDFSVTFSVNQTPDEVFGAVNNPAQWWGGIEGNTTKLGDEFTHQYEDAHYCKIKITEFEPNAKVVWHVLESRLTFMQNQTEWDGTNIVFEITPKNGQTELRFTHKGLTPQLECYESCFSAWTGLISGNLKGLITSQEKKG